MSETGDSEKLMIAKSADGSVMIGSEFGPIEKGDICVQFGNEEPFVIGSFDKSVGDTTIHWNPSTGWPIVFADPVSGKTMKVFGRAK